MLGTEHGGMPHDNRRPVLGERGDLNRHNLASSEGCVQISS